MDFLEDANKARQGLKLWFLDGNTREFYQIGISANKTGISVYILGIDEKTLTFL